MALMRSRELIDFYNDILREIKLLKILANDNRIATEIKNHASERAMEIISESISITSKNFNIEWEDFKVLVDVRNDIVHEYFDNSFELVQELIMNKLLLLEKIVKDKISKIK